MANAMMLENRMVIGEYYDDPAPAWTCPKCHREWHKYMDHSDLGEACYGYECDEMAMGHHPAHGGGCVCCALDDRTAEDAMAYAMAQRPEDLYKLVAGIIIEMGIKDALQLLHNAQPDVVGDNVQEWAMDQDDYDAWYLDNQ